MYIASDGSQNFSSDSSGHLREPHAPLLDAERKLIESGALAGINLTKELQQLRILFALTCDCEIVWSRVTGEVNTRSTSVAMRIGSSI